MIRGFDTEKNLHLERVENFFWIDSVSLFNLQCEVERTCRTTFLTAEVQVSSSLSVMESKVSVVVIQQELEDDWR